MRTFSILFGLWLALPTMAQDAAPADRNAVNTRARPGGMAQDSPVVFPEHGALPAQFPPDARVDQFDPGEPEYYLFASPERSLAQVKQIQAAMPAGHFTPPTHDWRHLPRTREVLTRGGALHLMAIGDSIVNDTMRSGWIALLREVYPRAKITATTYVRGGGGAQHFREKDRLARNVFPRRPDLVFLGGISQRSVEDLAVLIDQLRAGLPDVEILLGTGAFGTTDPRDAAALAAAPHSGTGEYGRRLRQLAEQKRCAFLDFTTPWAEYLNSSGRHPHRFYRDAVHANEFGEQLLATILMDFWQAPAAVTGTARVSGELQRWHRVTFDFEGPQSSEPATPNPFFDHRLDVTFTHAGSGETRIVPGYFAADGNAAETSATTGNVWRVRFSPPLEGEWRWRVSFRTGEDVAIAERREAGQPWPPLDGQSGSLVIGATDKSPPDFRARGHLEYVGERYLRFAGDGTRFLKGGPGSPEVMLGYADFDGTFRDLSRTNRPPSPNPIIQLPALQDGLLRFEPHVRDWREGDPTWQGGKGKGLIGGLNYLSSQGANSIYFVTMNVNGDGMNTWPWIGPWIRDRFDCSKLDQWEIVFSHAARLGLQLHIVTQETENDHLLDRGFLGRERKLYYRELIARFSHHPAITWNLGEENVQSSAQQKTCAAWLRHLLPYRQHVVIHNDHWHAKNLRETFDPLLGGTVADLDWRDATPGVPGVSWRDGVVPLLTGPAIQDFYWPDVHTHVRHYVRASVEAGLPWVVTGDELGGANFGTLPDADDPDHDDPRRFGLWGCLMAGGAGVEWYFGWQNNSPFSDLSCEDWRTRENVYRQTKIALDFFHAHLPFWRMQPAADAVVGHGVSGLIAPGELLAIYLPNGGGTRFDLGDHPGLYEVKWFNPRAGGELRDGNIRRVRGPGPAWTGFPPADHSKDWLALVRRVPETAPAAMQFPGAAWREMTPEEMGVHPNGLHHALNTWRMHSGTNGVDEVVMARLGVVFHRGRAVTNVHNVWSATKSFTSTALGLLVADGTVTLDTRAAELEPALLELYPHVTLRDFTTMTSGYDAAGRSRWGANSADWSATLYAPAPPLFAPGTKFAYWDEAQMMFGRVLTRAAGRDLFDLLRERVFDPIGLQVTDWSTEGEVNGLTIRNGCTGLQLDALNLARFGHLFLNEGRWGNRQLLPAEWVREATRPQVSAQIPVADTDRANTRGPGVYGFNWWVNGLRADGTRLMPDAPAGTYYAAGLNHNLCVVIPEWEMIIVRMGVDGNPSDGHAAVLNAFLRRLGLAVSPLAVSVSAGLQPLPQRDR